MRALAFAFVVPSLLGAAVACSHVPADAPAVVATVDLNRYAGTWFDVGHFPAPFQDDCACATARYNVVTAATVKVTNTCVKDGAIDRIEGTARVKDPAVPAKLGVRFFPIFEAPYWIVDLDEDYQWAVVSSPDKKYLWLLSRTRALPPEVRAEIVDDLTARGFDMGRLLPSSQSERCPTPT